MERWYGTNQNTECNYSQNSAVSTFTVHVLLVNPVHTKSYPCATFIGEHSPGCRNDDRKETSRTEQQ